jgi:PAS domain S-box-containing protein
MTSQLIEMVVDHFAGPLLVFSLSGRLEAMNDAAAALTEVPQSAVGTVNLTALLDGGERAVDDIGARVRARSKPFLILLKLPSPTRGYSSWRAECCRIDGLDRAWIGIRRLSPDTCASRSAELSDGRRSCQGWDSEVDVSSQYKELCDGTCLCSLHRTEPPPLTFAMREGGDRVPHRDMDPALDIQGILDTTPRDLALQVIISEICQLTGWDYAEIWIPDGSPTLWRAHPYWYGNRRYYKAFRMASERTAAAGPLPLVQRVAQTQASPWYDDISIVSLDEYRRAKAAREAGLKATLAVPVVSEGNTLAVLVFMMAEVLERDDALVEFVCVTAEQLSVIFRQRDTEEQPIVQRHTSFDTALARSARSVAPCNYDLLCSLLESIDRPAFIVVHESRVIAWANTAACRLFGYDIRELIGQPTTKLHVDEGAYEEFGDQARRVVECGSPFRHRFWMQRKDGTRFASEHLVTPVRDVDGCPLAVSLVTDLSEPANRRFGPYLERLSRRELDVFHLTIDGLTLNEIAGRLGLSRRTVEFHRAGLLRKLEVGSTTKLLAEILAAAVVERTQT